MRNKNFEKKDGLHEKERERKAHNEQWGWGELAEADSSVYTCGCIPYVFTISMFQLTSHGACQKGAVVIITLLTKGKYSH